MGPELMPVVFVVLVGGIIFMVKKQDIQRQRLFLEEQAMKRQGGVHGNSFFFYPKLVFPCGGQDVTVYTRPASRNSPAYTFMRSPLIAPGLYRVKIYRELRIFGVGTVFGQDIRTGDPEFDKAFVVQGSDEMIVRALLQPQIQRLLLGMKDWNPQLEIKNGRFVFQVEREVKNTEEMDTFIGAGLVLLARAQETG